MVNPAYVSEHMFLIVGLGNPGVRYRGTRHNVGFQLVDILAQKRENAFASFTIYRSGGHTCLTSGGTLGTRSENPVRTLLAKPATYMNLSGAIIGPLVRFYKVPVEHVLVVHDDLDLSPGVVRIKQGGGGHGGHRGLQSLDTHLGRNYWRLRIGIGHPGSKDLVSRYVLQKFSPSEDIDFDILHHIIADGLLLFFTQLPAEFAKYVSTNIAALSKPLFS